MIVMANWTPSGFIGRIFKKIGKYIAPSGMRSSVLWGDEDTARDRLREGIAELKSTRRMYPLSYPFGPDKARLWFIRGKDIVYVTSPRFGADAASGVSLPRGTVIGAADELVSYRFVEDGAFRAAGAAFGNRLITFIMATLPLQLCLGFRKENEAPGSESRRFT